MKTLLIYCLPIALSQTCGDDEVFTERSENEKFCYGEMDHTTKDRCLCKNGKTHFQAGGRCVKDCESWGTRLCKKTDRVWTSCMGCWQNCGDPMICAKYAEGTCPGGCKCPNGFQWDVKKEQCMADAECHVCPINSSWNDCASACSKTCVENPDQICTEQCVSKCDCDEGFVLDDGGNCILKEFCPEIQPGLCPVNSIWNECGSACESTCQNPSVEDQICTMQCVAQCECFKGFVKNEKTGACVPQEECPEPTCESNQVWTDCKSCWQNCGESMICMGLMPGMPCPGGCTCPEGTMWHEKLQKCVTESECQEILVPTCPVGQVWTKCLSCWQNCGDSMICANYQGECPGGCKCPAGFQWHEKKEQCIPDAECHICPRHSSWNDCASACPKTCVENPDQICTEQCVSKCDCDEGFVLDDGGNCILKEFCPEIQPGLCPANSVWNECGSACESTCQNPSVEDQICTMQCVAQCECVKGFVKNEKTGACVPQKECPEPTCESNQVWTDCKDCWQNCGESMICMGLLPDMPCPGGCTCPDGTMWHEKLKKCVTKSECDSEKKCPPGSIFNECGSACQPTCQNPHSSDVCTEQCVPTCECEDKCMVINEVNGQCTNIKQCPTDTCSANETWNDCATATTCEKTCQNENAAIKCPKVDNKICVSRCECNKGFIRDGESGKCIKPLECPEPTCESNKVWVSCIDCVHECGSPSMCFKYAEGMCPAGCTCPSGTMWDEAVNKCVTEKECKGCPSGSTWNNCGSACQPTCQNPLIPDDCTKQCVETCECDDPCMVINEENGQCTNVKQCPKANTECDERSAFDFNTNQCECTIGYQKHTDGKCYAFLSSTNVCNLDDLPFMSHFLAKRCPNGIKPNGKCKLQCRYDTKARSKVLPKIIWLKCKEAVDANGDVIGLEFDYQGDYTNYDNLCGKGCNLLKLQEATLMGPTAESINCDADKNGVILFGGPKTCKMQCKKTNDEGWLAVKKPFKCLCKDNITNDARICQWRFLDENPTKAFDRKFMKLQKTDAKCLIHR